MNEKETIEFLSEAMGTAIDDLYEVAEWLREEKDYQRSDRLRTIIGRLARSRPDGPASDVFQKNLVRTMAREWR